VIRDVAAFFAKVVAVYIGTCTEGETLEILRSTMRNLIVTMVVLQVIMTVTTLYIAWWVKDIYDAIPGEPISVTIEEKKK